jgi:hypothetical protein
MHYFSIAVLSTAMEITILSVFSAARANLPEADKAGGECTKINLSLNLWFRYGV